MNLYKFINMSDEITFYAKNDDIARNVTLLLGSGKAGCRRQDGTSLDNCLTAFNKNTPEEIYTNLENMLKNYDPDLIYALKTVAYCGFADRKLYDEYTDNFTNEEKIKKWNDIKRTSLNNFVGYSLKLSTFLMNQRIILRVKIGLASLKKEKNEQ